MQVWASLLTSQEILGECLGFLISPVSPPRGLLKIKWHSECDMLSTVPDASRLDVLSYL